MKKKYIVPMMQTISCDTMSLLTASPTPTSFSTDVDSDEVNFSSRSKGRGDETVFGEYSW